MSHSVNTHVQAETHNHQEVFLERLKKNLLHELTVAKKNASLVARVTFLIFYGGMKFIFEFENVVKVKNIITPSLVTYLLGKYCTLLPMYLVLPFAAGAYFIPGKVRMPILAVLVVASLLIVLAI